MIKIVKIEENKVGLVRVALGISNRDSGCVSVDFEDCEKRGNIYAVGFWHRHDEPNLEANLNVDARRILDCYTGFPNCSGAIITTEWKDYKKS